MSYREFSCLSETQGFLLYMLMVVVGVSGAEDVAITPLSRTMTLKQKGFMWVSMNDNDLL